MVERIAALLAAVLSVLVVSVAPGLAWPGVAEPTATRVQAYAGVELDIFSGRPNPQWTVSASELAPLLPNPEARPIAAASEPPGLGYRGFLLTCVSPETGDPTPIRVYGGTVSIGAGDDLAVYADTMGLEQWLLDDAQQRGYGDLLAGISAAPVSNTASGGAEPT